MRPLVSVITATYNWSAVLRYAMASVLRQTHVEFEHLIIGDGCTDDSGDVVDSFGDPRLRWHNLAENSGNQSHPNNVGLDMAQGKYVAYLGHDDLWYPDHLQLLVDALEAAGSDVAYTVAEMIGPAGSNVRLLTGLSASGAYERGQLVPPSSVMHRRDMIPETGNWMDYRMISLPPDTEFLVRAFDRGRSFTPVPELTVFKFNSAWRPGSYALKPSHEQAAYAERMAREPDFRYRELLEVARVHVLGLPMRFPEVPPKPEPVPPGWDVRQSRRIRGLDTSS